MRVLLLELAQLVVVAARHLLPRIAGEGFLHRGPAVVDDHLARRADVGEGVVDHVEFVRRDIGHVVIAAVDPPLDEVADDFRSVDRQRIGAGDRGDRDNRRDGHDGRGSRDRRRSDHPGDRLRQGLRSGLDRLRRGGSGHYDIGRRDAQIAGRGTEAEGHTASGGDGGVPPNGAELRTSRTAGMRGIPSAAGRCREVHGHGPVHHRLG